MAGLVACFVRGFKHISESLTLQISPFFRLLNCFCLLVTALAGDQLFKCCLFKLDLILWYKLYLAALFAMPVLPLKSKLHTWLYWKMGAYFIFLIYAWPGKIEWDSVRVIVFSSFISTYLIIWRNVQLVLKVTFVKIYLIEIYICIWYSWTWVHVFF